MIKKSSFILIILAILYSVQCIDKVYFIQQDSIVLSVSYNYDDASQLDSLFVSCILRNNSKDSIYINKRYSDQNQFTFVVTDETNTLSFPIGIGNYMWPYKLTQLFELPASGEIEFSLIIKKREPEFDFTDKFYTIMIDYFLISDDTKEIFKKSEKDKITFEELEWYTNQRKLMELHRANTVIIDFFNSEFF